MLLRYLWLGSLVLLMGVLGYGGWWTYKLEKPTPGNKCSGNGWKWDTTCSYIQEIKPDPSLKSPQSPPYLINFTKSEGAGPPIFLPMWYRYRYVNVLTGGYSSFSPWTTSPVMSGECVLPCVADGTPVSPINTPSVECPFPTGPSSCVFNQPVIGVPKTKIDYSPVTVNPDGGFIYMNLHRYVGRVGDTKPPDNPKDEIVGVILMPREGKYYVYIDVLNNPCKKGCPLPDLCSSKPCKPTS